MSVFDYLSVLFSVIMGLALTEVLQGFRALTQARRRVKIYWPALIWGALMILIVVQAWWGMFAMRDLAHWNFAMYGAVVLQITLMYMAAGVVFPEIPAAGPVDMRAAFYENNSWFFGLLALTVFSTFLKDFVIAGHLSANPNEYFLAAYFVLSAIAALTKSRWYHGALALLSIFSISASAIFLSFRI